MSTDNISEDQFYDAQDDNDIDPNLKERFNYEDMLILVDNDIETAIMMLNNFLDSEFDTFNKILEEANKEDINAINWSDLRKDAHSLKGSSSYLCLKQVSFLSLEMQRAAEAKNKEQVDLIMPLLVQEFELAVTYMDAKLQELNKQYA